MENLFPKTPPETLFPNQPVLRICLLGFNLTLTQKDIQTIKQTVTEVRNLFSSPKETEPSKQMKRA